MNKQAKKIIFISLLTLSYSISAQNPDGSMVAQATTRLFSTEEPLSIRLNYSNRDLKKQTNDSTYVDSELWYHEDDGNWHQLDVKMRTRGNYRLQNCYFPPVKLKIKKSVAKATVFEGNKKLKLVLPCLLQAENNDLVLKEFIAYKLFEIISPYYFKTRLLDIDFQEPRGKKIKEHHLTGFLIEDMDNVAERYNGNELKRVVHPLQQDDVCSFTNDLFQYLVANTDFSSAYQHNQKLLFVDKKTVPIPYDFDMSGLVDASYSVVSQIQDQSLEITDVTQRLFRGFKRSPEVYQQVRQNYLDNKSKMMEALDFYKPRFEDPRDFEKARKFIEEFFDVLGNDAAFNSEIVAHARLK